MIPSTSDFPAPTTMHLVELLRALLALRDGDFSTRLPSAWPGLEGKLADTVNEIAAAGEQMTEQFERVARGIGRDGLTRPRIKLGRSMGAWGDIEDSVNTLIEDLLAPITELTRVLMAVTRGELGETAVPIPVRGAWEDLSDTVHELAGGLEYATQANAEHEWQHVHAARLITLLQEPRDLETFARTLLSELAPLLAVQHGVVYRCEADPRPHLRRIAVYAEPTGGSLPESIALGQGLVGQCALEQRRIVIDDVRHDATRIGSALLGGPPRSVVVQPISWRGEVVAVIELATLGSFTPSRLAFLDRLAVSLGALVAAVLAANATDERLELEHRAEALAATSRSKSEFLANMSHELRTPLNSILILGQQLSENPERNLTPRQVEFARTIHAAGSDLLHLVSEILDLSKIESGTVTIEPEPLAFETIADALVCTFRAEAERRKLSFDVCVDAELGPSVHTDPRRLLQILRSLLSNAFKFTERGGVRVHVFATRRGAQASAMIAFAVSDTGIGILRDRQRLVFEPFPQAEDGSSRMIGGPGLGLAIGRELAILLGGELELESTPGLGSTFTLYLPLAYVGASQPARSSTPAHGLAVTPVLSERVAPRISDDRTDLRPGDRSLLVVEQNPDEARILLELARAKGFKTILASRGGEALALARELHPSAISLDVDLPDLSGWIVLDRLKQELTTRHIPVHVVARDDDGLRALAHGACSFITQTATREALARAIDHTTRFATSRKRLLVVHAEVLERTRITRLLGHDDIDVESVGTGGDALDRIARVPPDCVVLGLRFPDMHGFDLLARLQDDVRGRELPVVVFTGRPLAPEDEARLRQFSHDLVVEVVESPDRLLDRTCLFLHRKLDALPPAKQELLERLHRSDDALVDRTVLVVDDDVRNVFTLASVLERHGMKVLAAQSGTEALTQLESAPQVGVVLIDGDEAIARIRGQPAFRRLPIVALTGADERATCLGAGASDHLAKPVDTDQLLASLRSCLHR